MGSSIVSINSPNTAFHEDAVFYMYNVMFWKISALLFVITTSLGMNKMTHTVASVPNIPPEYAQTDTMPQRDIALTTDTWGIFNPKTGEVLAGSNIDTPRPIASVTKLFTAYAVLQSKKTSEPITITWSDLNGEGRAGKLTYGEQVTLRELLFPLLIESSNDAGEAIERILGKELFTSVDMLHDELALSHTHIEDATGLSSKDVSGVVDLARFFTYLKQTYPQATDITQLNLYVGEDDGLVNNNPARSFSNFTGGKHGFTEEAGRTFVGTFAGARNGGEIGMVILGSTNLKADIGEMLTFIEHNPMLSICYNAGECGVVEDLISYNSESHTGL